MGKLFRIGPVVMEIQALKVEKNLDFPEIFPPGGRQNQRNPCIFVQAKHGK